MQGIVINPAGAYTAAFYFSLLPGVILIFAYLRRKRGKSTGKWEVSRQYWYLPIDLPVLLYFGLIYWWLFYDQFYRIIIQSNDSWKLEYLMPKRTKVIFSSDISEIQAVTGDIRTYKMTRILILTKDGKRYLSAQISQGETKDYLEIITKYLRNSTGHRN